MNQLEAKIRSSAKRQGLHLWQVGPRVAVTRVAGEQGEIEGRITGSGLTDMVGCFGGRFLAIEAKSTEHATRLDLGLMRPHQCVLIKRITEAGGLAAVLAELGARTSAPRYYLIPPGLLLRFYAPWQAAHAGYGKPAPSSIPAAVLEAEAIGVPVLRGGALDLVAAIEALQRQQAPQEVRS